MIFQFSQKILIHNYLKNQ